MMKRFLLFLASLFIGLIVFILVIGKVGLKSISQVFSLFSGLEGLAIVITTCLICLISIWQWKFILKTQGYNLSKFNLGKIWLAGFAIKYLTPVAFLGAETFKIYSIKKKFSIPWEKSIAAALIEKLLSGSIFLLFSILGIFSFFLLAGFPSQSIGIIIGGIIFFLVIILSVFYFKIFRKESILRKLLGFFGMKNNKNDEVILNTEKEIFSFFRPKKRWMWKGLGFAFLKYSLVLIRCFLIIFFLGGGVKILTAFAVYAFAGLANFFPVPASLGTLDVAEAFAFGFLGLGSNMGAAFSLILRGAELLVCLVGVVFLAKLGVKLIGAKIVDKTMSYFNSPSASQQGGKNLVS